MGSRSPDQQQVGTTKVSQSAQRGTCGRIVHLYSDQWSGPRPGIVVCGMGNDNLINVNVFLDGLNDGAQLAAVRESGQGNTLGSVPLYDALSDEDRRTAIADAPRWTPLEWRVIAEWPPRS